MRVDDAPRSILMTLDAVGGVWRYAMDAGRALRERGVEIVFAGFGPPPTPAMAREAEAIGKLCWSDAPLDWMVRDRAELARVPREIERLARRHAVDLVHLNLPSMAADLAIDLPAVVASHSCVTTWFASVRGTALPPGWEWHETINRLGLAAADAVIAPSRSHAEALAACYGATGIEVVPNASALTAIHAPKQDYAFAAGRWWDEGKNGAVLDRAAALCKMPIVVAGSSNGPNGEHVALSHVDHRGALGHAEAMTLMADAAIFVSPSVYEPFGLAALEAARSGAALVLADIPTYRELWDGAALFCSPRDPAAFAGAIERLARDLPLRATLADAALGRSGQFTLENQARCLLAIYRRAIGRRAQLAAAE